jgi:D-glycero-D-manno-heptose 1,7-bisphosphate phosphatase
VKDETSPIRRRAAFIDRDGVINVDSGYVHRIEDFVFLPGAIEALKKLQTAGYALVVTTNQAGLARGLFTEPDYWRVTSYMQDELWDAGVKLSAVEHCPHLPDANIDTYRLDCLCRKPRPGMLIRATSALNIDLSESILVGDRASDIEAGRRAGVGRCLIVRSGHPVSPEDIQLADGVYDDLAACARHLLLASEMKSA